MEGILTFPSFMNVNALVYYFYLTLKDNKMDKSETPLDYLNKLLQKHQSKIPLASQFATQIVADCEEMIQHGIYQIKQGKHFGKQLKENSSSRLSYNRISRIGKSRQNKSSLGESQLSQLDQSSVQAQKRNESERKKFMQQMIKARKEMQKKREQKIRQKMQQQREEEKKQEEQQRKKQEQLLEKRREEIQKRNNDKQTNKKKIQQENQEQNRLLKEKMKQKILVDKLEEKFKKQQIENLMEKKKKLAEIRSLHRPFSKNQFEDHLKKIQQLKAQVPKPKSQILSSRYQATENKKFYHSVWYNKEKGKKREFQNEKHEDELYELKEMKDRSSRYSQNVRKNYKPEPSQKVVKEIEERSKSLVIPQTTEKDLRKLGLKYLQYSKDQADPTKVPDQHRQQIRKAFRYMNYLEQRKRAHEQQTSNLDVIEAIKKRRDLSTAQKKQKMLKQIEKIEKKAKMKEEVNNASNQVLDRQPDKLYMKAIKAKLQILTKD